MHQEYQIQHYPDQQQHQNYRKQQQYPSQQYHRQQKPSTTMLPMQK
ncbi:unnamed protein product, partial [Rotaria sp. Silwood2]